MPQNNKTMVVWDLYLDQWIQKVNDSLGSALYTHEKTVILAWPCRDKKTPPPDLVEELKMDAWCLLKKDKENYFPFPHSSFDYKNVAQ